MRSRTMQGEGGRARRAGPHWGRLREGCALALASLALPATGGLCGLAATAIVAAEISAQAFADLSRDDELRLAMSAGPLTISQEADVWVFGPSGFEKAIEGTNGHACMVIRSADDPELLAPHCFSPDAVRTVLPGKLEEARLQRAGLGQREIDEVLLEEFESGSLPLPSGNAYAYMLSSGQRLGRAGNFHPHFMLYMPYATNEEVGGDPAKIAFPFVGPQSNHPHSTMVILMTEFVDPADVVLPR